MIMTRVERSARQASKSTCDAGFTLVEILIASAILTMALIPIVSSFHTLVVGFKKTTESTHGAFLAQSVMENIRYRLYNFDARYYGLNDTVEARAEALEQLRWKLFFQDLAETEGGRWVVDNPQGISRYFIEFQHLEGTDLHAIRQETNPALWKSLKDYSAEVHVFFDGLDEIFDPDGDEKRQTDMAGVRVVIHWIDHEDVHRSSEFETVLTRYQYEPNEVP